MNLDHFLPIPRGRENNCVNHFGGKEEEEERERLKRSESHESISRQESDLLSAAFVYSIPLRSGTGAVHEWPPVTAKPCRQKTGNFSAEEKEGKKFPSSSPHSSSRYTSSTLSIYFLSHF